MTTIKSTIGWLFGVYKHSNALQGLVIGIVGCHIVLALVLYFIWLYQFFFQLPCR